MTEKRRLAPPQAAFRTAVLHLALVLPSAVAFAGGGPPPSPTPAFSPASPAAPSAPRRLSDRWRWLVGEWRGEGEGGPGAGGGTSSFAFDLGGQVLVRRSHSSYDAGPGRPATVHDDLLIVHPGSVPDRDRAVYFDNEGHVIDYDAAWSEGGDVLAFVSAASPGAPRVRLTYRRLGDDLVAVEFAVAPPGKPEAFAPYVSGRLRRAASR